jgi:hypothetical protein
MTQDTYSRGSRWVCRYFKSEKKRDILMVHSATCATPNPMLDLKDMGNISEGLWIAQRETPDLPGW